MSDSGNVVVPSCDELVHLDVVSTYANKRFGRLGCNNEARRPRRPTLLIEIASHTSQLLLFIVPHARINLRALSVRRDGRSQENFKDSLPKAVIPCQVVGTNTSSPFVSRRLTIGLTIGVSLLMDSPCERHTGFCTQQPLPRKVSLENFAPIRTAPASRLPCPLGTTLVGLRPTVS